MQTQDSQAIVKRFFQAIQVLKDLGRIRGRKTFTDRYNINRRNLYTLEDNPESDIFQVAWLFYLVRDFGFSSRWLLTGRGEMFDRPVTPVATRKKAIQES
ncbi:MAG: hypothetical protein AAGU19_07800 [Prolixibacteraceae bacterium]